MLVQINIQNFAIIKQTTIDFFDGLTIITGETGAGKSIVIDAINQLLGVRASSEMVGIHQDLAYIEGVFTINDEIQPILDQLMISYEEDYIIISKTIKKDGKSQLKINNRLTTNENIKLITKTLVEIHSQDAAYHLKDSKNQLNLVDSLFTTQENELFNTYQINYQLYQKTKKQLNDLLKQELDPELLSYYQKQLNDINENLLSEEELIKLENDEKTFKGFVDIKDNLTNAIQSLKRNDALEDALTSLGKLSELNEAYQVQYDILNNIIYQSDDLLKVLQINNDGLYYDEDELNIISDSLFHHQKLMKKYAYSYEDVLLNKDKLIDKVEFIKNGDQLIKKLENKVDEYKTILLDNAQAINKVRLKYIKQIEDSIKKELNDLYLNDAQFKIELKTEDFHSNGNSSVIFLFNANKGMSLQPLNKVASGGELARLMLALKIITQKEKEKLLIFDEIDTGVSGEVADAIGLKLATLAQNYRVISITHLFQVARYAKHHLYIEKNNNEQYTTSNTKYLDYDEQVNEIAKMLSGDKVSPTALKHAQELKNYE